MSRRAARVLIAATVPATLTAFLGPLSAHFRGLGWTVDAVARGADACADCVALFDRVWDAPWSRNPANPANLLAAVGRARELLAGGYSLAHAHTPVAGFVTRLAASQLPRRVRPAVVYTAHGFHFHSLGRPAANALYLALERLAGRWTDYLVVMNREDEEAARRHGIVAPDRVRYMPGIGVDTREWRREAVPESEVARVRGELGLSAGDRLLLMVAELSPRKRHADAIKALARLNRPDVRLAFAGAGPLEPELRRLAASAGVADRVRFLGFRSDVMALVASSAATLLPSIREGLPRSVMESMCLGVPVIGARVRGTRDLLEDGGGILTDVGDVAGLAEAMAWVIEHPVEAGEMGRRGRELVRRYDVRNVLRLHEELYTEALGIAL